MSLVTSGFGESLIITQGLGQTITPIPLQPEKPVQKTTGAGAAVRTVGPDLVPTVPLQTEALGIHQSDVIIRSALVLALKDLRRNPWLLDYVFASLPRDPQTANEYGELEVIAAKKWFLSTNIPVFFNQNLDSVKFPCLSISLMSSVEDTSTLGDVHYVPQEDSDSNWPTLVGPLTPILYTESTGILTFSASDIGDFVLVPGMVLVTVAGTQHPILNVEEVVGGVEVTITPSAQNFNWVQIKGSRPGLVTEVESSIYREVYAIGAHVSGEPAHLTYLHSILVFILLRYKQELLEARGFERSVLNSSDFSQNTHFDAERVFTRFCQVTGYVRHHWPKTVVRKLASITGGFDASPLNQETPIVDLDQDALSF